MESEGRPTPAEAQSGNPRASISHSQFKQAGVRLLGSGVAALLLFVGWAVLKMWYQGFRSDQLEGYWKQKILTAVARKQQFGEFVAETKSRISPLSLPAKRDSEGDVVLWDRERVDSVLGFVVIDINLKLDGSGRIISGNVEAQNNTF